jgi:hypothetical protein
MMRTIAVAGLLFAGIGAVADETKQRTDVDVARTTEKIVEDATEAGKRLGKKDPGNNTQRLQKDVLKGIDDLLKKAQEPPPKRDDSSSSNNNSGSGGMSGLPKQNLGGKDSSPTQPLSRQERRERNKAQTKGGGQGQKLTPQPPSPDPKAGLGSIAGQPNRIEPKGTAPRMPDVYKDVWGHLPEKMRQEMDLYFREQFMPRYSELLRQYYSSLAERGGKAPGAR